MRAFIILSVLELFFWAFFISSLIKSYIEIKYPRDEEGIDSTIWVVPAILFFLASLVGFINQII